MAASRPLAGRRGPAAELIEADFGSQAFAARATGYNGQQTDAITREFPDCGCRPV